MTTPQERLTRWLQARAVIATDLYLTGKISSEERERACNDSEQNRYTSPIQFIDGTTPDEWHWMANNGIRAKAKTRP